MVLETTNHKGKQCLLCFRGGPQMCLLRSAMGNEFKASPLHLLRLLLDLSSRDFLLDVHIEASPGFCHCEGSDGS